MHDFNFFLKQINEVLEQEDFRQDPIELYEPIEYTLDLGGKRIRPILALLACEMFGGNYEDALYPAVGIEVFHNFTLLHDDIMDDAPIRRGKETVYKKWNVNRAILSGDTMFALAYKYVTQCSPDYLHKILNVFNQTAIEVCEGQQFDMNFETSYNVGIEDYLNMIRLKTAVLLGGSLKVGAIIGGASPEDLDNIYDFGVNIGMAFQLKDDLLDSFGDESKFGKKTGGDIVTNKKTFLYLKAFELANTEDLQALKLLFNASNHINPDEKVLKVLAIYRKLNIAQITEKLIDEYYNKSIELLNAISVEEENKVLLRAFADKVKQREM